jgi:hypothetical protein
MPSFVRMAGTEAQGIILHAELWPLFATHADAVIYVDDLLAWRDGRYQSVRQERGDFFMKLADSTLAGYRTLRAKADTTTPPPGADTARAASVDSLGTESAECQREIELFNAAAVSILYLQRAGAARSLVSFWSSEKTFLERYLPEIFFQELETIYTGGNRQADLQ